MVNSLDSGKDEDQDHEEVYKMANVMSECEGLTVMLQRYALWRCQAKRSLMTFFWKSSVIPKEGWARQHAPILLLLWQQLRHLGTFVRNAAHLTVMAYGKYLQKGYRYQNQKENAWALTALPQHALLVSITSLGHPVTSHDLIWHDKVTSQPKKVTDQAIWKAEYHFDLWPWSLHQILGPFVKQYIHGSTPRSDWFYTLDHWHERE